MVLWKKGIKRNPNSGHTLRAFSRVVSWKYAFTVNRNWKLKKKAIQKIKQSAYIRWTFFLKLCGCFCWRCLFLSMAINCHCSMITLMAAIYIHTTEAIQSNWLADKAPEDCVRLTQCSSPTGWFYIDIKGDLSSMHVVLYHVSSSFRGCLGVNISHGWSWFTIRSVELLIVR